MTIFECTDLYLIEFVMKEWEMHSKWQMPELNNISIEKLHWARMIAEQMSNRGSMKVKENCLVKKLLIFMLTLAICNNFLSKSVEQNQPRTYEWKIMVCIMEKIDGTCISGRHEGGLAIPHKKLKIKLRVRGKNNEEIMKWMRIEWKIDHLFLSSNYRHLSVRHRIPYATNCLAVARS